MKHIDIFKLKIARLSVLLLFLASLLTLSGCSNHSDEPDISFKRTVLVYMMADNSLSSLSGSDINEMTEGIKSIDTNKNNLLIYIDTFDDTPKLIKLENKNGKVVQTVLKNYPEQTSTDESVMTSVFSTAFSAYPADSYGLVLWSHGLGWIPQTSSSKIISRYAGVDQNGGGIYHYLNIPTLQSVLATTNLHFDYILFDECYMASVEALYQLRGYADYFIGSPTEIPGPGAYYTDVVHAMFANSSSATAINNADKTADAYYNYYRNKYDITKESEFSNENWIAGTSVSLIKSSALENLANATKNILPAYIKNKAAINTSNIFCYDPLRDKYFYDLESLIKQLTGGNSEYITWKTAFDNCVIKYQTTATNYMSYSNGTYNFISMNGSYGLSGYIPSDNETNMNTNFQTTQWYIDAGWNQTGW